MNFALSDEQQQIRDAAQVFLADVSDSAAVRKAADSAAGYDAAVWRRLSGELGWCATVIPEAFDGLGLGAVEMALIQEQCGHRLLCAPFLSCTLAATVLMECADAAAQRRYLPPIASGQLIASVPLGAGATQALDAASMPQAHRHGDGWRLQSDRLRVPDGGSADLLLVLAHIGDRLSGLFALPRNTPGVTVTPETTWDATRRFATVELRSVAVTAAQRLDDGAMGDGPLRSAALARLYIAAEQLGGAQSCLDMTVAYTAGRKQFGRSIASFQAVKHRCAEMMVRIETARSAVYGAAALAAGTTATVELEMDCATARVLASEAYFFSAQEAIQLHGGVGFTWEYDPQLHFKRAQASSHWLGNAEALRARLADQLLPQTH